MGIVPLAIVALGHTSLATALAFTMLVGCAPVRDPIIKPRSADLLAATRPARTIDISGKGTVRIGPDQAARHAPTGLLFPPTLVGLLRVDVHSYNEDASNVSGGYRDLESGASVTLYVYPLRDSAEQDFLGAMEQIEEKHPKWKRVTALKIVRESKPVIGTGFAASYESDGPEPGFGVEITSEVWVFPLLEPGHDGARYVVKMRTTFPTALMNEAAPMSSMLLHEWLGIEPIRPPPDADMEDIASAS